MLRTTASRSARPASFGRCSHTWTPGTLVATGLNSPALGVPGFMSKVSVWAGPPAIHSRIQALRYAVGGAAGQGAEVEPLQPLLPGDVRLAQLGDQRRAGVGELRVEHFEGLRHAVRVAGRVLAGLLGAERPQPVVAARVGHRLQQVGVD